jgi:hypothetical protein
LTLSSTHPFFHSSILPCSEPSTPDSERLALPAQSPRCIQSQRGGCQTGRIRWSCRAIDARSSTSATSSTKP